MFSHDFSEFVGLLQKHEVEYLIVGGYAVSIHGHPRYTGDMDVWLNQSVENARKIVQCIEEFGFASFNLKEEDFTKADTVIQLGYPPLRIDLLTDIDGVSFTSAFENKKVVEMEGLQINFIGYKELIENKRASGRLKDLDDIDNLSK